VEPTRDDERVVLSSEAREARADGRVDAHPVHDLVERRTYGAELTGDDLPQREVVAEARLVLLVDVLVPECEQYEVETVDLGDGPVEVDDDARPGHRSLIAVTPAPRACKMRR
jgi:hypothetical protein